MKKTFIYLMICSFINFFGCYYQEQIIPTDYRFDEAVSLEITTRDTAYNVSGNDYFLESDTLMMTDITRVDRNNYRTSYIKVPTESMRKVKITKLDASNTILLTAGVLLGIGIFVALDVWFSAVASR